MKTFLLILTTAAVLCSAAFIFVENASGVAGGITMTHSPLPVPPLPDFFLNSQTTD